MNIFIYIKIVRIKIVKYTMYQFHYFLISTTYVETLERKIIFAKCIYVSVYTHIKYTYIILPKIKLKTFILLHVIRIICIYVR